MSYDRYEKFRHDGIIDIVPFVKVPESGTDIYVTYDKMKDRLDLISFKYYGDGNYGWLILQSNPQYGSMEFRIPDQANLRVPYPLADALNRYNAELNKYKVTHP